MNIRAKRNRTFDEWEEFKRVVALLDGLILPVLSRVTEDADLRRPITIKPDDPEWGSSQTHYNDPTGEMATSWHLSEATATDVDAISQHIHYALNTAQRLVSIAPRDAEERAQRTVPDCMACGDPCAGRVRAGLDEKCYKRWQRMGRPDRQRFIAEVKGTSDKTEEIP